jgi:hypothetical protein
LLRKKNFLVSHVAVYQAVAAVLGAFKGLSRASEAFSTQTPQSALNRPQNPMQHLDNKTLRNLKTP